MELLERFDVDAPLNRAWSYLCDPHLIAQCFPGTQLTEQLDDTTFAGQIVIRFGPTTATFTGKAGIIIDENDHTGTIEARGTDRRGTSRATATVKVRVEPNGEQCTIIVQGSIDVTGPLEGFAAAGGVQVTRVMLADFAANVAARANASDSAPASAPTPASEVSAIRVLRRALAHSVRDMVRRIIRWRASRVRG